MKITSAFTTNIISKLLKTVIRQKLGCNVNVLLNEICISIDDGNATVHLNMDATLNKEELVQILSKFGM